MSRLSWDVFADSSTDLLIFAWALNVTYNVFFIWQAQTGIGRHIWDVLATNAIKIAKVREDHVCLGVSG